MTGREFKQGLKRHHMTITDFALYVGRSRETISRSCGCDAVRVPLWMERMVVLMDMSKEKTA